jgi:protein-L-isoaspartate(D-aspartate) O-methyltransferase
MTTVSDSIVQDPVELRAAMVNELRDQGAITSEPVALAFTAVPRHLFAPDATPERAYAAHGTVVAKLDPNGSTLSVMSAAHLQAVMLEQAGIEPGMRVLEVGSGGYNAALIQELVGQDGKVTTVDIDPDIVDRARACLTTAGYDRVNVVLADAEAGVPHGAPYDRIIVTFGAWDIPPAWIDQLAEHGRIVVPLRLCGLTRSIAFDRDGEGLLSRSYCLARFVPAQGDGAYDERKAVLRDGIALQTDSPGVRLDTQALNQAFDAPRLERWSGAAYDLPDELELYLTLNLPQAVRLHAAQHVIDQGLVESSALLGVPALVSEDSIAYRLRRENQASGGYESGVVAHGPQAESLAEQYVDLLQRWARDYRRRGAALFQYLPTAAAPTPLPQGTVTKRHGILAVSWH